MVSLDLPVGLEKFRSKLEATVKPYIAIQTQLTSETTLWQSKFAGFPYMPKNCDYPKTLQGEYLYLLAQINFLEVPKLEGYPERGILQFYISDVDITNGWNESFYGLDFEQPTCQAYFRILYFPDPDLNEGNLVTNFDFLPVLWDRDFYNIPFSVHPRYSPQRDECFALTFQSKSAPITIYDYQCEELLGNEFYNLVNSDEDDCSLLDEYGQISDTQAHKLGGYPDFTQEDPRLRFSDDEEQWILLLQINSDDSAREKIEIQWGDIGICNFFIKASALSQLDFSSVLYNWDCP